MPRTESNLGTALESKVKVFFFSLYVSSVIFDFLQSTSSIVNRKDISTSLTGCLRVSELRLVTVKIGY